MWAKRERWGARGGGHPVASAWGGARVAGGWAAHQAMTTHIGTTKRAICVDDPMAMPSESSILFLTAKMIAAAVHA